MGKTSLVCIVITQVSLCFALYIAVDLGHPQNYIERNGSTSLDLYFISVKGVWLQQQYDLLRQAIQEFPSPRLPWYIILLAIGSLYWYICNFA